MDLQNLVNATCSSAITIQVRMHCDNETRRQIGGVFVDGLWTVEWPSKSWNNFVAGFQILDRVQNTIPAGVARNIWRELILKIGELNEKEN